MAERVRPLAQRRLMGPLILIALGVLLLLTNLGVVPWGIWQTLLQFWPVLLILLGLELLLSGRASWGAALVAALVLLVVAVIAGGAGLVPWWMDRTGGPGAVPAEGVRLEQPAQGATAAEIQVSYGAGRFNLAAGAGAGMLVDGLTHGVEPGNITQRYQLRDGVGVLDLEVRAPRGVRWFFRPAEAPTALDLRLGEELPIRRLVVSAGAVDAHIDLSGLQVQHFELDTGASSTRVRLPSTGVVAARINAGASSLAVEVPAGMAARILVEGGAVGFDVDEQRFPPVGPGEGIGGLATRREYRSPDFDTSPNRVELRISAGAASVEVR